MNALLLLAGVVLLFSAIKPKRPAEMPVDAQGRVQPPESATWNYTDRWPPPGLPQTAPLPSARGAAAEAVAAEAREVSAGNSDFESAVLTLAWHESGASYNLPAFKYDSRPEADRPIDPKTGKHKGKYTAWGLFQWQDGWAQKYVGYKHSYQMTEADQVLQGVRTYWDKTIPFQGDARAIFIAHVSPTAWRKQAKVGLIDLAKLTPSTRKSVDKYLAAWRKRLDGATV